MVNRELWERKKKEYENKIRKMKQLKENEGENIYIDVWQEK